MTLAAIRDGVGEFWASREPRERWILGIGGLVLLAGAIYAGLWRPAATALAEQAAEVEKRRELVTWLSRSAAEARVLREERGGSMPSGPLRDRLEEAAEEAELDDGLAGLAEEDEGRIRADLDEADFRRTMIWLQGVERRQAVHPVRVRLERTDRPGRVDGRLILEER
ncbi:MAG: type II secretion system protein GspM [Thiohalospira sp.]